MCCLKNLMIIKTLLVKSYERSRGLRSIRVLDWILITHVRPCVLWDFWMVALAGFQKKFSSPIMYVAIIFEFRILLWDGLNLGGLLPQQSQSICSCVLLHTTLHTHAGDTESASSATRSSATFAAHLFHVQEWGVGWASSWLDFPAEY